MNKELRVTCKTLLNIPLDELHEIQGDLKTMPTELYAKFSKLVIKKGIWFATHVWKESLGEKKFRWCIVDGTGRKRMFTKMRELGWAIPAIPCVEIEAKDLKEAKEAILAASSRFHQATPEGLYEFMIGADISLEQIKEFDIVDIDIGDFEEEFFTDSATSETEDEVPEPPKDPKVRLGDLWRLGDHRVLCGDSTDKEQVERLMNGERADMVFTDPPYGMNLDTNFDKLFENDSSHAKKGDRFRKVEGDDSEYDPSFIFEIFACQIFIWGADYFYSKLPHGGSLVCWDKRNEALDAVPGNTAEFCFAYPPVRRTTARILWSGHHGMQRDDSRSGRIHPTQKPTALAEWFFERWGKDAKIIWDGYLGSGSTLIACEKTKRKCYGLEIDESYCTVIIERYLKYTGRNDVYLVNSNGTTTPWKELVESRQALSGLQGDVSRKDSRDEVLLDEVPQRVLRRQKSVTENAAQDE